MASDRSFRQRLRTTVLEANTPAGKIYNLVIFGAILLSVVVLLFEPNPLGNSALQQTEVLWIDLVQDSCLAVFAGDFVLHLAVVPSPRKYLFSFTGLIDLSAVLFFFVPQVRSELLLWVFKFGRILRVFKLLKFIDEAKVLAQALLLDLEQQRWQGELQRERRHVLAPDSSCTRAFGSSNPADKIPRTR